MLEVFKGLLTLGSINESYARDLKKHLIENTR